MSVEKTTKARGKLIGTSIGLAVTEYSGKGCEQVYARELDNVERPILLEFWEGYAVPNRAILTKRQAIELAFIILKWALAKAEGK